MRKNAFIKPSRGTSRARVELQSTETLSFRCCRERCHLSRGAVAFTLAEVLITLGIIGVVAALTIPTLISNYQTRAWQNARKVFEAKYTEALRVMNTQGTLAGYKTTEDFLNEFSKYIKINTICTDPVECFEDKVYYNDIELDINNLKTSKDFGWKDWDQTNAVGVQFADGVTGVLAYNTKCKQDQYSNEVNVNECTALLYDTSAMKDPNESGKDLNMLNVHRLLNVGCAAVVGSTCVTQLGFHPKAVTKAECEQMIKDGYGIKECSYENDYWAGAVKACGGVKNMPTVAQLKEIGADIYSSGSFNEEKSVAYGFQKAGQGNLLIFSNVENTSTHVSGMISYGSAWSAPYTYRINHWGGDGYQRNSNAVSVICAEEY